MLAHVWERVTHLLDSHTRAEEEIWLLRLTMRRRLELGHQWLAYVVASRLELAPAGDPAASARFKGHL